MAKTNFQHLTEFAADFDQEVVHVSGIAEAMLHAKDEDESLEQLDRIEAFVSNWAVDICRVRRRVQ